MIEAAEKDGRLKPGGTIVEATAGNTGLGLALVGSRKGYRIVLIVPDKMAREKILHAKAMGAEIVLTRSDVGKGHPDYYQDMAEAITQRTPGAIYINQFENPANPQSHYETTGPEILKQMEGDVDAVVVGVGSGGTLTGIGRFMKCGVAEDDDGAGRPGRLGARPLYRDRQDDGGRKLECRRDRRRFHPRELRSQSRQAGLFDQRSRSFRNSPRTPQQRGNLCRVVVRHACSSAALKFCRAQSEPKRVVSLVCDSGAKYLSKVFNDAFLAQEGWTDRQNVGTVRDIVINRYNEGSAITVQPGDTVRTAFARMRAADVSQLPVVDSERIVGLVDESDMLSALLTDAEGSSKVFAHSVKDVMVTRLETISADAPIRGFAAALP